MKGDILVPNHDAPVRCRCDRTLMQAYRCIPNRCRSCSRDLKRWLRSKTWKKKLTARFSRRRHHHIRMATVGMPGTKIVPAKLLDKTIDEYRSKIIQEFNKLRKRSIWSEHVDGGIWFFEATIDILPDEEVKVNPHLHMVLLCPKMFPVNKVNEYILPLSGIQLGRFWISTPRNQDGTIKKCTPADSINYCMSYLKKDTQLDGRNRQTFGNMHGK